MTQWVNFAEIRKQVSLEDVLLGLYGLTTLQREGDKLIGACPVHGGDSPRAFHADLTKNLWHCFSRCKGGGNQLDFVAKKEGISIRDAALKIHDFFLTGSAPPSRAPATPAPAPPPRAPAKPDPPRDAEGNPPLELTLNLLPDHPHLMEERALPLEVVSRFGVGYCPRGILAGMIAIPIHDADGTLVAYAGRRLKPQDIREKGKYRFPKGFRKELVLFNYHRAKDHLTGPGSSGLILVEGFFSVLELHALGFPNVVASMGCDLSEHQAALLSRAPQVLILFDGNEAGWRGAEAAREQLGTAVPTRLIRLPEGYEPEDLEPRALRWLANGATALDLADVSFAFRNGAPPGKNNGTPP